MERIYNKRYWEYNKKKIQKKICILVYERCAVQLNILNGNALISSRYA